MEKKKIHIQYLVEVEVNEAFEVNRLNLLKALRKGMFDVGMIYSDSIHYHDC